MRRRKQRGERFHARLEARKLRESGKQLRLDDGQGEAAMRAREEEERRSQRAREQARQNGDAAVRAAVAEAIATTSSFDREEMGDNAMSRG